MGVWLGNFDNTWVPFRGKERLKNSESLGREGIWVCDDINLANMKSQPVLHMQIECKVIIK